MRSAEREGKSVVFDATNAVPGCHTLRGGVWHDFSLRSTTATFVYLPHFAVVSHFETALPLRTREKGGGRERPPQKTGGSCGPAQMAFVTCLCPGPHGVAHVLIYPCGKAQKQPPGAALKARRRTYEMAVAPVGKNPLSPRLG